MFSFSFCYQNKLDRLIMSGLILSELFSITSAIIQPYLKLIILKLDEETAEHPFHHRWYHFIFNATFFCFSQCLAPLTFKLSLRLHCVFNFLNLKWYHLNWLLKLTFIRDAILLMVLNLVFFVTKHLLRNQLSGHVDIRLQNVGHIYHIIYKLSGLRRRGFWSESVIFPTNPDPTPT